MADHNDPNAVNSIFSDIDVSAADLYDIFGFPADDRTGVEKVVIALTFAAVPQTGVFDTDMLYRILIAPDGRIARSGSDDTSLAGLLAYLEGVKDKYLKILKPSEVRVTVDHNNRADLRFIGFPGGSFSASIATNQTVSVRSPGGHQISAFVGGRDDAFFNDLTGFFRSINYAPQFYHVPHTMPDVRELKIPKTFLELEGNDLLNYDPQLPRWGHGIKKELPAGSLTWSGDRFRKDHNGNFRRGRQSGAELQCDYPGIAADLSDGDDRRAPRRQCLRRKLGIEGGAQGRDDSRRSIVDRTPSCFAGCLDPRRRAEEIQAGRYRRPGLCRCRT